MLSIHSSVPFVLAVGYSAIANAAGTAITSAMNVEPNETTTLFQANER